MNIRILLVDDFPLLRQGLAAALETDPALKVVGQADDGEEGLRLARELQPDVVILDLHMPGMGGIEFLRELRADPKLRLTPVVVLTTSGDEKDRIDAYDFHVAGYLRKPVEFPNFMELTAALNKYWTLVEMP